MSPAKESSPQPRTPPERSAARFLRHKTSRVELDFRRLTDRVQQRLYPETTPVLASYWLKTVYWSGYSRDEWRELDRLLKRSLAADSAVSEHWRQVVADIRNWIRS